MTHGRLGKSASIQHFESLMFSHQRHFQSYCLLLTHILLKKLLQQSLSSNKKHLPLRCTVTQVTPQQVCLAAANPRKNGKSIHISVKHFNMPLPLQPCSEKWCMCIQNRLSSTWGRGFLDALQPISKILGKRGVHTDIPELFWFALGFLLATSHNN